MFDARLPGSLLIPLSELSQRARDLPGDANVTIVVYCHHGVRSLSGAFLLERYGAVSLRGGIEAWSLQVDPSTPRY